MPIDIPVVVGSVSISGNTYPIYGTLARGIEYLAGRLNTAAFDVASADNRSKAFSMARLAIDRASWDGSKTVAAQATAFPRTGLTDCEGVAQEASTVPLGIEFAQYELGLLFLTDASKFDNPGTASNIKRLEAGPAKIEFFRAIDVTDGKPFPNHIFDLVRCFLAGQSSGSGAFFGGTCNEGAETDYELERTL